MHDRTLTRRSLCRWMGWFAIVNAGLFAVIGLRYFAGFAGGGTVLSWIYLMLVYPAHYVLLAVVPLALLVAPVVIFRPRRNWLVVPAVVLYATIIAVSLLDSLLWSQSRFHLNALTAQILGWQSWVFTAVMWVVALWFETLLAGWTWRLVLSRPRLHGGLAGGVCAAAIVLAQSIHAWADATYYVPVTSVGQQLPVYEGFTAKRLLTRFGLVDPAASREREMARRLARDLGRGTAQVLDYPLHPLRCSTERPLNLLLILADAMRADMLSREITPYLWRFAQSEAQWFTQHFSGGNSSRMGVFSLFYGLPPGYWSSFEALQRSPVLIDELQNRGYAFGLFSSASMYRPVSLDRTAFANVRELRLGTEPAGAPGWQRDRTVTADWRDWLDQRDPARPFFGFLFYDATNTRDYPPETAPMPGPTSGRGDELDRRFADYRRSVRFVDGLVARVIADLEARELLDRTVIVFSSDHGEEFDDSGAGLKDHGSGYTRYQLQVPMLIRWPGRTAHRYDHRTSHYDLVPTLMQELLGCSNPPSDYASGSNLFDAVNWRWLLAGSYYNYAVLESDQITITFPNGRYEVRDWQYRLRRDPQVRGEVLQSVTRENARFYR